MGNKKMYYFAKMFAQNMIRRDMSKWPPDCFGLSYQPVRPMQNNHHDNQPELTSKTATTSK